MGEQDTLQTCTEMLQTHGLEATGVECGHWMQAYAFVEEELLPVFANHWANFREPLRPRQHVDDSQTTHGHPNDNVGSVDPGLLHV